MDGWYLMPEMVRRALNSQTCAKCESNIEWKETVPNPSYNTQAYTDWLAQRSTNIPRPENTVRYLTVEHAGVKKGKGFRDNGLCFNCEKVATKEDAEEIIDGRTLKIRYAGRYRWNVIGRSGVVYKIDIDSIYAAVARSSFRVAQGKRGNLLRTLINEYED